MTFFSTLSSSSPAPRPVYTPGKISDGSYIRVFDTTLRDGEQAPGAAMTVDAKVEIAHHLAKLKVDIIEAGFPTSSKDDFEAVKRIAKEVGNSDNNGGNGYVPVICVISRMTRADIANTWEAVRHAKRPRMNVFISTSDIHMKYKLNKNKDEVLEIVRDMVSYTRSLGAADIQFSSEDCSRSEKEFLYEVFGEAIKAGATTIGLGDTVGCQFPEEWGRFVSDMIANVPGIENAIISTHCHNDLGLATANTLAALSSGARQAEVTINGIGERAGNASLEEVVMAIKCRGMDNLGGLYTGINTKEIVPGSKMVEKYSGLSIQPHKAIVGANAFAHASGIHQDGMLKFRGTYEIISPEDIGLQQSSENGIVLGRLSGRRALQSKLLKMGIVLDDTTLGKVFWRFKDLASEKKNFSEDDLHDLLRDAIPEATKDCDQI